MIVIHAIWHALQHVEEFFVALLMMLLGILPVD